MTFETRAIEPQKDWFFYRPRHSIDESDRQCIRALTDDCARAFWRETIARRWKPLPRFLPSTHWANRPIDNGPDWYAQWNTPTIPDPVMGFLRSKLKWAEDREIFALFDDTHIYVMKTHIFINNWNAFVSNQDDIIILNLSDPAFVRFGDSGVLFAGRREFNKTLDPDVGEADAKKGT